MGTWSKLRVIRLGNVVPEKVAEAERDYPQFAAAFEGLQWVLARQPERGIPIVGTKNPLLIYRQASRGLGVPVIEVVYHPDDTELEIVNLRAFDRPASTWRRGT